MASHSGESQDSRYDRDSINTANKAELKNPATTIHLAQFNQKETAAEAIQRTADYARDPRTYLESNLGNKVLSEREHLLCIPKTVDRDFYGTGEHKQHFEQHIAKLFGKEHGLFFITGIQAQLAALKVHADRAGKNKLAWQITSHLEGAEQSAYKELYGLDRVLLGSDPDNLATVDEITKVLHLAEAERPAAILIELPNRELGCQTYSYDDLCTISKACREAGVKFHLDGARIWEIEPYFQHHYNKTFSDIGNLFDTLYVSFYKGLRGACGAMLVAPDADFIAEAKKWQRRAGGNMFQSTYEVVDCQRGFNEMVGTFGAKWAKMAEVVDAVTTATSKYTNDEGQPIVEFWPKKAMCSNIRTAFHGFTASELEAARDKVDEKIHIRVFERFFKDPRQRRKEVVTEQPDGKADKKTEAEVPKTATTSAEADETRYMIEWVIAKGTFELPTKVFVDGYVRLCEELAAARKS